MSDLKKEAGKAMAQLFQVMARGETERLLLALSTLPEDVFYVVHDESFGRKWNMEFPSIEFITPDDLGSKMLGRSDLMVLDHYCLCLMLSTIADYIGELESQILEKSE